MDWNNTKITVDASEHIHASMIFQHLSSPKEQQAVLHLLSHDKSQECSTLSTQPISASVGFCMTHLNVLSVTLTPQFLAFLFFHIYTLNMMDSETDQLQVNCVCY